jgi:KDO2-lipid IV(A) lauroyltransferase
MDLLEELGRDVTDYILVTGHYGNWELVGAAISLKMKQTLHVLYKPLSNKYFDRLIYNSRVRFKTRLISIKESSNMIRSLIGKKSVFAFISDQAAKPDKGYWTTFLNRDAAVFWGAELIAKKYKLPLVYLSIKRVSRGHYDVYVEKLFDNPRETKRGEITERYTRRLEKDIIEDPEIWLWTHNRWKHKKPEKIS